MVFILSSFYIWEHLALFKAGQAFQLREAMGDGSAELETRGHAFFHAFFPHNAVGISVVTALLLGYRIANMPAS